MRYTSWLVVAGAAAVPAGCGSVQAGGQAVPAADVAARQTPEQCQLVDVVTDGKTMPSLDGSQTLIQQVVNISGLRWPDFPAAGPTATSTAGP